MIYVALLLVIFAFAFRMDWRGIQEWNRFAATLPMTNEFLTPPLVTFEHVSVEFYPKGLLSPWMGGSRLFVVRMHASGVALRCEYPTHLQSCFLPWASIRACELRKIVTATDRDAPGTRLHLVANRCRLSLANPAGTAAGDHWQAWREAAGRKAGL